LTAQSQTLEIDGIGPVLFERSRRARRLIITVRPFSGVRVAVPRGVSFRRARQFAETRAAWANQQRMRRYEESSQTIAAPIPDAERAQIRDKLVGRLRRLADRHGFTFNRVFIRQQRTRWGSCSHRNNISLNARLARLPDDLSDYVILHELTHTRQPNHGPAFWTELDRFVGDGKGMAKRLGEYGLGLP